MTFGWTANKAKTRYEFGNTGWAVQKHTATDLWSVEHNGALMREDYTTAALAIEAAMEKGGAYDTARG